jgi:hypothetical protein
MEKGLKRSLMQLQNVHLFARTHFFLSLSSERFNATKLSDDLRCVILEKAFFPSA